MSEFRGFSVYADSGTWAFVGKLSNFCFCLGNSVEGFLIISLLVIHNCGSLVNVATILCIDLIHMHRDKGN